MDHCIKSEISIVEEDSSICNISLPGERIPIHGMSHEPQRLQNQCAKHIKFCSNLQVKLSKCRSELLTSREQSKDLAEAIKDLRTRLEISEEKAQQLMDETTDMKMNKGYVTEFNAKVEETTVKILKKENKKIRAELVKYETDFALESKRHSEYVQWLRAENDKLTKEIENSKSQSQGNLTRKEEQLKFRIKDLELSIDIIKDEHCEYQRQANALISNLKATISGLESENKAMKSKSELIELALSEILPKQHETDELQKKVAELESSLNERDATLNILVDKLAESTAELQKEETYGRYLASQLEKCSQELTTVRKCLKDSQRLLERERARRKKRRDHPQAVNVDTCKVDELRKEIDKLKDSLYKSEKSADELTTVRQCLKDTQRLLEAERARARKKLEHPKAVLDDRERQKKVERARYKTQLELQSPKDESSQKNELLGETSKLKDLLEKSQNHAMKLEKRATDTETELKKLKIHKILADNRIRVLKKQNANLAANVGKPKGNKSQKRPSDDLENKSEGPSKRYHLSTESNNCEITSQSSAVGTCKTNGQTAQTENAAIQRMEENVSGKDSIGFAEAIDNQSHLINSPFDEPDKIDRKTFYTHLHEAVGEFSTSKKRALIEVQCNPSEQAVHYSLKNDPMSLIARYSCEFHCCAESRNGHGLNLPARSEDSD
ncbi:hypothetical protein Ddc_12692 [Ditylenchus destructor]|nr:hypothetical protein Ddc_12692 [Ditylenchus destructor]